MITTQIFYSVASISDELSCHKDVLGHEVSTVILYIDCLCDFKSDGASWKKKISLTLQRIRRAIHHGLISLCHVGLSLSCIHAKTPFVFSALFVASDKMYVVS